MADVRSLTGVPPASAFSSSSGTPVVVDRDAGTAYVMKSDGTVVSIGGGGGGGAPTNASYLTLGTDATLTAERVLTAGDGVSFVDTGAGGTLTVTNSLPARTVAASLAFGGSFTDKAETVVTGQTWVTANTRISAQVLTPSGTDPDEMYLLDLRPVISSLSVGNGWTVTLYTEPEARGTYTVMCVGN
jgi:hypothetical protein